MDTVTIHPLRVAIRPTWAIRFALSKGNRYTARWVAGKLECRHRGAVHSTDRIRVERGGPAERWCGFHAALCIR